MELQEQKCTPCEQGGEPLKEQQENELMSKIQGWELDRSGTHMIRKTFDLGSFPGAIEFVDRIAKTAQEENHHPDIHISYKKVTIELSTHKIGGLSDNDFIMAAKIDEMIKEKAAA